MRKKSAGLLDYLKEHPTEGGGVEAAKARDYGADAAAAAELRQEIEAKMQQAAPPQEILYDCFSLVGCLAHDDAWADKQKERLTELFDGLTEPELFPLEDAGKLEAARNAFQDETIKRLKSDIAGCTRLADALRVALRKAEGLTDEGDELPL